VNTDNQITNSGFTYDAAGDLTADGVNTYSWNAEAHLKSAAGVTYTYDGDLRRVKKSSGTLYWYCATCGNVLAESDLSGNLTSEYTFFGDRRVARRDVSSGNVYYIFSDRLGSYRTLTGSSGNVQGESDYYPFGAERVISSTMTDNFRFAGMEWDSEDGLNHTLYRKYTPAQCRWESPDPVRGCVNFPQGQDLYAYVKDSPTNFTDPNGDQWPPAGCLNNAFVGRPRAAYTADYSDSDCICNWDPVACCIMAGECGGGGGDGGGGGCGVGGGGPGGIGSPGTPPARNIMCNLCLGKCNLLYGIAAFVTCGIPYTVAEVIIAAIDLPGAVIGHVIGCVGLEAAAQACVGRWAIKREGCRDLCRSCWPSGPPRVF